MAHLPLQPFLRDDSVNLSNLPVDIIRKIVPLSGNKGLARLRLISPLWNMVAQEFLANRRLHPPIECVRILSGLPHWPEKDVRVSVMVSRNIRPDFRGAFKGWTECSWAIPIDSPVLRLRMIRIEDHILVFFIMLFILAIILLAYFAHPFYSVIVLFVIGAMLVRWWTLTAPGVTENRECLSRIFARTSSIGQLLFLNLDRNTLKIVRKSLKDVPIIHLMIVSGSCDEALRNRIVEMVRAHKVEQVTISSAIFKKRNFRKLLFDLDYSGTVKELEILENVASPVGGTSRNYWEKIAREIRDGPFKVEVMEEERYNLAEGTHLLRLRLTKRMPIVIA